MMSGDSIDSWPMGGRFKLALPVSVVQLLGVKQFVLYWIGTRIFSYSRVLD